MHAIPITQKETTSTNRTEWDRIHHYMDKRFHNAGVFNTILQPPSFAFRTKPTTRNTRLAKKYNRDTQDRISGISNP